MAHVRAENGAHGAPFKSLRNLKRANALIDICLRWDDLNAGNANTNIASVNETSEKQVGLTSHNRREPPGMYLKQSSLHNLTTLIVPSKRWSMNDDRLKIYG
ncbi:hypothetical protein ACO0LL_27895 [Undibacterium sp. TC4M20W]